MILSELRSYLQQHRRVPLNDLVLHFGVEADALRGMLQKWIGKGKLRQTSAGSNCGSGCCKCDPLLTDIYEWIDDGR